MSTASLLAILRGKKQREYNKRDGGAVFLTISPYLCLTRVIQSPLHFYRGSQV